MHAKDCNSIMHFLIVYCINMYVAVMRTSVTACMQLLLASLQFKFCNVQLHMVCRHRTGYSQIWSAPCQRRAQGRLEPAQARCQQDTPEHQCCRHTAPACGLYPQVTGPSPQSCIPDAPTTSDYEVTKQGTGKSPCHKG